MEDIAELFAGLRFAKRIVGGVEERDVWKKLDEVQAAYRKVYEAQHERDLALIEERDETIRELSASLERIEKLCGDSAAGVEIPKAPAPYQDDEPDVRGAAREPYLDNSPDEPEVKGASRKPVKTHTESVTGRGSARESVDSLSSESSAEADLAFDWLDDGDFNL